MRNCEECGGRSAKEDVCTVCGLVFNDHPISNSYETNKTANEDYLIELSEIKNSLRKKSYIKMNDVSNPDLRRALKKYYYPWKEKRESKVKKELKRICSLLGLKRDFYISCVYFYHKLCKFNDSYEKNIFKGANKVSLNIIAQTIVFLEIRRQRLPFMLKDFERIECETKDIQDYYTKLCELMEIKIKQPSSYIFLNKIILNLGFKERKKNLLIISCKQFLENIFKLEKISKGNPIIKAGAAIYILTSDVTQHKICDIIGCSVQTLRNRYKEMKEIIHEHTQMFSISEKAYESIYSEDEYTPFVNNVSSILDIEKELANCLINPKYKMKIKDKPFFD